MSLPAQGEWDVSPWNLCEYSLKFDSIGFHDYGCILGKNRGKNSMGVLKGNAVLRSWTPLELYVSVVKYRVIPTCIGTWNLFLWSLLDWGSQTWFLHSKRSCSLGCMYLWFWWAIFHLIVCTTLVAGEVKTLITLMYHLCFYTQNLAHCKQVNF